MYCNTCFMSIRPGELAVAISCGHLTCPSCFQSVLTAQRCSVCSKSTNDPDMGWREVTMAAEIRGPTDLLQLAGHSVEACMSLSFAAIQFKCRQDELYAKLRYEKLTQKLQALEAHYRKKIGMMNQGYEDMKQQVESLRREKQEMEGDIRELRDKYSQKTREARSLRAQVSSGGGGGGDGRGRAHSGNIASHPAHKPIGHTAPPLAQFIGANVAGANETNTINAVRGHQQRIPGINGLPSLPPMGHAQAFARAGNRMASYDSPTNFTPRSPHHPVRSLAYGPDNRYASPNATPARSSPSMLISTAPMAMHRTPPSHRQMNASGALRGLGAPLLPLGGSARSG